MRSGLVVNGSVALWLFIFLLLFYFISTKHSIYARLSPRIWYWDESHSFGCLVTSTGTKMEQTQILTSKWYIIIVYVQILFATRTYCAVRFWCSSLGGRVNVAVVRTLARQKKKESFFNSECIRDTRFFSPAGHVVVTHIVSLSFSITGLINLHSNAQHTHTHKHKHKHSPHIIIL